MMNIETGLGKTLTALENIEKGIFVNYLGNVAVNGGIARGVAAYNASANQEVMIYTNNEASVLAGSDFQLNNDGYLELTGDNVGKSVPALSGDFVNAIALENGVLNNFVKVEVVAVPYIK